MWEVHQLCMKQRPLCYSMINQSVLLSSELLKNVLSTGEIAYHKLKLCCQKIIKSGLLQSEQSLGSVKGENKGNNKFLAPLALGQRAYVMVCCPLCIRPCVCQSVR